jgi:hypothetical protein
MAKQKKQAMVRYNEEKDRYELYLRNNDNEEWGFSYASKCVATEGSTETNFIYFGFLRELMNCINLGYEVIEG